MGLQGLWPNTFPSPMKRIRARTLNAHLLVLHGCEKLFPFLLLQGDPYDRGKDYVDIKFKVPSQAWVAGQPYS